MREDQIVTVEQRILNDESIVMKQKKLVWVTILKTC